MSMPNQPPPVGRPLHRDLLLNLLETALFMGQTRFARQSALDWLAIYPGDLPVSLIYAQTLLKDGRPRQALPVLERIARFDPEYVEAAQARLDAEMMLQAEADRHEGNAKSGRRLSKLAETLGCVAALEGAPLEAAGPVKAAAQQGEAHMPGWSRPLSEARLILQAEGDWGRKTLRALEKADALIHQALAVAEQTSLVAVTHLQILFAMNTPPEDLQALIEHYRSQWPNCLHFMLYLAEARMLGGDTDHAVADLHQVAAHDITGQVAARMWGPEHPYKGLWPQELEMILQVPIPASVSAALGWNQLPQGHSVNPVEPVAIPGRQKTDPSNTAPTYKRRQTTPQKVPETLVSVQDELARVAARLHKPGLADNDGRYPVYVMLTTRQGLKAQYGSQARHVSEALERLAAAIKLNQGWNARVYYADEGLLGVPPAQKDDPWAIKLALADLDVALSRQGEMIGALLIVGGAEIVPFHNLPNPVDDIDDEVPSDNPYATRDENYFIPEWPVGRLPGDASGNPDLLLKTLAKLAERHTKRAQSKAGVSRYRRWLQRFLRWLPFLATTRSVPARKKRSFGYTAAVWRRASLKVFRPIGDPRALRVSPPAVVKDGKTAPLPAARLGYFNLHGLADAAEWYGQPEVPAEKNGQPPSIDTLRYPVAVRPQDVLNSGRAPEVVFSEACYGAHIFGKSTEQALALKFLQAGSQAVVGSTSTSYGAVNAPLTAADLLGQSFWTALRQGQPAGEALRQAKIALAREMHQRQGYLDGEDQKTLISFVLYGDPLAQPFPAGSGMKSPLRSKGTRLQVKTICDRSRQEDLGDTVPDDVMLYVKRVVEQYLPGMSGSQVLLNHEHAVCNGDEHRCPTSQMAVKTTHEATASATRRVVVLSKEVRGESHHHTHYARLTLDEGNRLVKLVVSR